MHGDIRPVILFHDQRTMMAEPLPRPYLDVIVGRKQMVFAIPVDEDGIEGTRFVVEDAESGPVNDDEWPQQAGSVIGAGRPLVGEQPFDALARIRHESRPTPPIDMP